MSVELILDPDESGEGEGFELAPNHAWRALATWALDRKDDLPALATLAGQGAPVRVGELARDLARLDDAIPASVRDVTDSLLTLINDVDPSSTVLID